MPALSVARSPALLALFSQLSSLLVSWLLLLCLARLLGWDVIYCFLSPAPMPALWEKACAEMRPSARLISNSFEVPGVEPQEVLAVDD